MKRSLAVLALLTLSSASLCAAENYNREKVLALFAQYNPTVLEKAQQNADYNTILQSVAQAYNLPETDENRYTLLALIRNFDNSLDLNRLSAQYEKAFYVNVINDLDPSAIAQQFRSNLVPVFSRIWAVSVQTHKEHLKEAKAAAKALKKDASLTAKEKENALAHQKATISFLKQEIKNLKKDSASQIVDACDSYATQTEQAVLQEIAQSRAALATHNVAVKEVNNLSITSKNKKPVAK